MTDGRTLSPWRRGLAVLATFLLGLGSGYVALGRYRRTIGAYVVTLPLLLLVGYLAAEAQRSLLWGALSLTALIVIAVVVDVARIAPAARLPGWGLISVVWFGLLLLAAGERALLRSCIVESFKIPSASMVPALQVGDHVFVNKFIYGIRPPWGQAKIGDASRSPRRGEVIVFAYPQEQDKDFIKRVMAVAGDTIDIRDNQVFVNGQALSREPLPGSCKYDTRDERDQWALQDCVAFREENGGIAYPAIHDAGGSSPRSAAAGSYPLTVPPRSVFVMGDNRDNSHDSRHWGVVPYDLIKGRASFVYYSTGPLGLRSGRINQLVHP